MYKKLMLTIILILSYIVASCSNQSSFEHLLYIYNIYNKGEDGNNTTLISASLNGDLEAVQYLVENGADVNAKDNNDWTSLMYASLNGKFEVAEYLIKNKANINIRAENGMTALDLAKFYVDKLFEGEKQ